MTDKTAFKITAHNFKVESNVLLHSSWDESPLPFRRFLNCIEGEELIKTYLDDCVGNHTPEGFNAEEEVAAVSNEYHLVFGPFSTVPKEESAQVYLILKELIAQNIQGRGLAYYGYSSDGFDKKYKGFLDKVARRLVINIDGYLTTIGIAMGLDDGGSISTTINGNVEQVLVNQAANGSTINATQTMGVKPSELQSLIDALTSAAAQEIADSDTLEEILDNIEIMREQMESDKPKRGLVKSAFSFLSKVNAGAQFAAALAQIAEFFNTSGIQLALPS